MRGNPHVRFGPGAIGKGPTYRAPRRWPTGAGYESDELAHRLMSASVA